MRRKSKKIICFILCFLFVFNFTGFAAFADTSDITVHINIDGLDEPPDITANAAVLMDAKTGELIYEKNSGRIIYPASTVKIMTAIIVLENVADLESQVSVSRFVVQNTIGNTMPEPRVTEGETFTVEDLLYALLLRGANDAALALAEHTSGTVTAFVAQMNEKAAELGCTNTRFTNPTGMHSADMHTTASDMAKITFHASQMQKFMDIACSPIYTIPATNTARSERTMLNRNHFVSTGQFSQYYYEYARGINFGSTTEGGLCLTTVAEQSGLSYLGLVMGSASVPIPGTDRTRLSCFPDMQSLFEWAFSLYSYRTVVDPKKDLIESVEVQLAANKNEITLIPDGEITVLLPKNADIDTVVTIDREIFKDQLVAPIDKGDILGRLTVIYDNEVIGTVNLISNADVEPSNVLYILEQIKDVVSSVWFRASVIIFIVLFAFYIAVTLLRKGRTKERRFY